MSNNLREITVQNAAIEWLQELGYQHVRGNDLHRDLKKVVLEDELRSFLTKTYSNAPVMAINEALAEFTQLQSMDLDYRNREFHLKLTQGVSISWKDKEGKECAQHMYPIDFESPEANSFICSDEITVIGKNKRRTDLLIFINGLPLVFFEFKNLFDQEVGVEEAYQQMHHYTLDIPQVFDFNAISVVSDGREALHGMYSAAFQWFSPWKSVDGDHIVQNDQQQLNTLIFGLFPKAVVLNYIQNYIFHEDHNGKLIKKGAKYHQFYGIQKAVESTLQNVKPNGGGRLGVIWHTQGSGKSISMAILTGILRTKAALKNPTVVIQVDRSDLDEQLYENFVLCKDLVGDVQHAESTDDLRRLLSSDGGGVIFTTIEKFRLKTSRTSSGIEMVDEVKHPVLSERTNIIVLADEAHRTQYGFNDGGYAQNLRRALPNASFLGFTGTPVDSKDADTELVFGRTIHTYDIKQAVQDGATVPIYYEPKMIPLNIKAEYTEELESATVDEADESNAVWAAIEDAAGAEDRVAKIASDILNHYAKRTETLEGKAMIVCMSRRNCVKMYDALVSIEGCPEIAVIMSGNISKDPIEWNPHIRTSKEMEAVKDRLKNPTDPLKMVIVRDMWLTGMDAPCLHTMYVDKIMKGHNLMQAIA
ncbi:MAG: type I restriction endonuclease subunit R, partial [Flavobacteriales bacterium]|nr:type I restriction endonuclease subunit R [Flavobacteriales bacterium]